MTPARIGLVTADPALADELRAGFAALDAAPPPTDGPLLDRILRRAHRFLAALDPPVRVELAVAATVEALPPATLVFYDARATGHAHARDLLAAAEQATARRPDAETVAIAPDALCLARPDTAGWQLYADAHTHIARLPPPGERAAWALARALDHLQRRLDYRIGEARNRAPVALARLLHDFLRDHHFAEWTFGYLTGSPIAGFIQDLEALAHATGAACVRGPCEHALAAGAFATWHLHHKPFVVAVSKGMMDEFKGTLANLRNNRARGFIVAVEDAPGTWYGVQAAITPEEDVRDVLAARRLACLRLHDPATLAADIDRAFALYQADEGPVVLLVSPELLGARLPEATLAAIDRFPPAPPPPEHDVPDAALDAIAAELADPTLYPIWHIGAPLARKALRQLLDLADRAGLALANTILAPGAVPDWHQGRRVPHLLGTIGVYTFREAWHRFTIRDGRIDPAVRPAFLDSRISGMERPFTDSMLRQHGHVLQITRDPAHHAPFATALPLDAARFITRLAPRVAVPPEVVAARRARIEAARAHAPGIVDHQRTIPMTANHFLEALGHHLAGLVEGRGHDYRVVVGASRTGFAAANHLPMTKVAHSGLLGRALMGDALMALPALAFASDSNLVVCVGDGERNLVPDVLPALIENHLRGGRPLRHNVTIFYGFNNAYSMVETFLSISGASRGGMSRQATNVNLTPPDADFTVDGLRVVQRTLVELDAEYLTEAMTEPSRINLFPVLLTHNDSGDGMTLQSMRDWRYRV